MSFLSLEEINEILSSSYLFDLKSFYIIDRNTRQYETDRDVYTYISEAETVKQAFKNGHTIVVKNLEHFSTKIFDKCLQYGRGTDAHLYLTPKCGGVSFDYHKDDRDVLLLMLYGEKIMWIKEKAGEQKVCLGPGEELFIAKNHMHRAECNQFTAMLSLGVTNTFDYVIPNVLKLPT